MKCVKYIYGGNLLEEKLRLKLKAPLYNKSYLIAENFLPISPGVFSTLDGINPAGYPVKSESLYDFNLYLNFTVRNALGRLYDNKAINSGAIPSFQVLIESAENGCQPCCRTEKISVFLPIVDEFIASGTEGRRLWIPASKATIAVLRILHLRPGDKVSLVFVDPAGPDVEPLDIVLDKGSSVMMGTLVKNLSPQDATRIVSVTHVTQRELNMLQVAEPVSTASRVYAAPSQDSDHVTRCFTQMNYYIAGIPYSNSRSEADVGTQQTIPVIDAAVIWRDPEQVNLGQLPELRVVSSNAAVVQRVAVDMNADQKDYPDKPYCTHRSMNQASATLADFLNAINYTPPEIDYENTQALIDRIRTDNSSITALLPPTTSSTTVVNSAKPTILIPAPPTA